MARFLGQWVENSKMKIKILVTDAKAIGSVAIIRSLGRAGYFIVAGSVETDALGFYSGYVDKKVVTPDPSKSVRRFKEWFFNYVKKEDIKVVIPSGQIIDSLLPEYEEVSSIIPFFMRDKETFLSGFKKYNLFRKLIHTKNIPRTILVNNLKVPNFKEIEKLNYPLFVKCDSEILNDSYFEGITKRLNNFTDLKIFIDKFSKIYEKAVIQEFVDGRGVGAFTFLSKGKLLGKFMHFRDHEVPFTGGVSALRSSFYNEAIYNDALEILRKLGWEGISMLEYRYNNKKKEIYLMEMNARFWGSLHLALYSNVDFPKMLVDNFLGKTVYPVLKYPLGIKSFVIEKEIQYVWSVLKGDKKSLTERGLSKAKVIFGFFFMLFQRDVYEDLFFYNDKRVGWIGLKKYVFLVIRNGTRKFIGKKDFNNEW